MGPSECGAFCIYLILGLIHAATIICVWCCCVRKKKSNSTQVADTQRTTVEPTMNSQPDNFPSHDGLPSYAEAVHFSSLLTAQQHDLSNLPPPSYSVAIEMNSSPPVTTTVVSIGS